MPRNEQNNKDTIRSEELSIQQKRQLKQGTKNIENRNKKLSGPNRPST